MLPYYLLYSTDFNPDVIHELSSGSQIGIKSLTDDTPYSSIIKSDIQEFPDYITYNLKTETLKKQKGRAYGQTISFDSFILIKNDLMFFNADNNLLLISTSKDNFNKFTKRFANNTSFNFSTVSVNFKSILDSPLNLSTDSLWLDIRESINLNAVGLMGHEVRVSNDFQKYLESGAEITNISFSYNYNGTPVKIMISKDGGIILFQSKPTPEDLPLTIDVYKKMLLQS